MEENELLEALDRRAAVAVAALDDRLADVEPPPLPIAATRDRRRWAPLLVAAALVVVALLGIGLALDGRDEGAGPVADDRDTSVQTDDGELIRLALADPEPLGYEVTAAFDGPSLQPSPGMEGADLRHVAHGPTGTSDPWTAAVVSMETPAQEHSLTGELVDLGGPEAVHLTTGTSDQVIWLDGERAHSLISARVLGSDLVELARAAVAAGWSGEGPLPGHEVLLDGPSEQFRLGLLYASTVQTGWQAVAYAGSPSGPDFVIGWRPGGADAVQGLHAFEVPPRAVSVAGREVLVSAGTVRNPAHATWLEEDDTVVQVATYGDVEALLAELEGRLEPISEDDLRTLARAHPTDAASTLVEPPESVYGPFGEGEPLASVALFEAGVEHRLEVQEDGPDGLALILEIDDGTGVAGSGGPLRDLGSPSLSASSGSDSGGPPLVVSGLLPADVSGDLVGARFVDETGAELRVVNWVTSRLEESGAVLVVVLLDAVPGEVRVDATFPTAGGDRTWRL